MMSAENLMRFDQIPVNDKTHLLLGNGFSMAYDHGRFSFTSLLDSAVRDGIIEGGSKVHTLFQRLATADFESVMRLLDESVVVTEIYSKDQSLINSIAADAENVKNYLVKIITNNHPEKSTSLTDIEKQSCLNFIKPFKNIYSLNYDLLLYWATMHDENQKRSDGFGDTDDTRHEGFVIYLNNHGFEVHYMHGALHIFDAGNEIIKKTYNNTNVNLVDQVRESLDKHTYPVFISEGTSEQKMTKILHSAYLNHCYKSLKVIKGSLVIYGASLKSNDEHILKAVLQSGVTDIYFGTSSIKNAEHIIAAIEDFNSKVKEKRKKKLHLFDYRTVDVWGRNG